MRSCFVSILLWTGATSAAEPEPEYVGSFSAVPAAVVEKMKLFTWRAGCPVPIESQVLVRVTHWGYDGEVHQGELVVHKEVGQDIVDVFRELFRAKFPVERMKLIEDYQGIDDASMDDNNTSAFNCRDVAGKKGVFSNHSWGRAIDINPLTNPYVTKKVVSPKAGKAYLDRTKPATGLITADGVVLEAFKARGWAWGGNWERLKDYQHFEKPAPGEAPPKK